MSNYNNKVIHLELSDVDVNTKKIKNVNGTCLVVVYAPWCGHCKNLKPVWEQLTSQHKDVFLAIDATDKEKGGDKLAQMFGVGGFPTILIFENGVPVGQHQGGRDADSLKKSAKLMK